MDKQIVISVRTIIIFFLVALGFYVVYQLGPVLSIVLYALLIVLSVERFVKLLTTKKVFGYPVTRGISVVIVYTLLVLLIAGIVTLGLPPVVTEGQKLIQNLPTLITQLPLPDNVNVSFETLVPQLSNLSNNFITFTLGVFSNITTIFTVLMLAIYMSLDWENIRERMLVALSGAVKRLVSDILDDVELTIGEWIKGQTLLMLIIGFWSYFGLALLGVEYPLALGIISGVLEAVPVIGPIIAGAVAGVIAFSVSPLKGIAVVVLYFIIQQVENNFLVPKIMGKVSGYGPIVILFVLLVASHFFGIPGAILAMPVFLIIMIVVKRLLQFSVKAGSP